MRTWWPSCVKELYSQCRVHYHGEATGGRQYGVGVFQYFQEGASRKELCYNCWLVVLGAQPVEEDDVAVP